MDSHASAPSFTPTFRILEGRGRILAMHGDRVDVRREANRQVKTHSGGDVHASELATWATVMKKDSACSLAKDAPQPASVQAVFVNKDPDATPAPVFVKIGRKRFPATVAYGGRLKFDKRRVMKC